MSTLNSFNIYNPQTGKYEEVKVSTKFTELKNVVILDTDTAFVDIGITKFNPVEDILEVVKNTTVLNEGTSVDEYVLNKGELRIENPTGLWKSGTKFYFRVLKNVDKSELPSYDPGLFQDGAITKQKLEQTLQDKIENTGVKSTDGKFIAIEDNTTMFNITDTYDVNNNILRLYYQGIYLEKNRDYTQVGKEITLTFPINTGEVIDYQIERNVATVEAEFDGSNMMNDSVTIQKLEKSVRDNINLVPAINSQLAENQSHFKSKVSKSSIYDAIKTKSGLYQYYQCVVSNPLNVAYANEPIGIFISFEKGECKTDKCIEVYDNNNNLIPFQWEADTHPNTGADLGSYDDGSLRHGTIWIIGSLTSKQSLTYTIKAYTSDTSNTYSPALVYNIVDGTHENFSDSTNGLTYKFDANFGWFLQNIIDGMMNMSTTTALTRFAIKNSAYSDINSYDISQTTNISHTKTGSGVIFMDYTVKYCYNINSNIVVTYKCRVWKTGKVTITTRIDFIDNIDSGVVSGVMWKNGADITSLSGTPTCVYNSTMDNLYLHAFNGTNQFLFAFEYIEYNPELVTTKFLNYNSKSINNSGSYNCVAGWQLSSPTTVAFPKGSMFVAKYHINLRYNTSDIANEVKKLHNPIKTRATKENLTTLKSKFISLASKYLINTNIFGETNFDLGFEGTLALHNLGLSYIENDKDYLVLARQHLDNIVKNLYNGTGAQIDFYSRWKTGNGFEYFGRNLAVLRYLRLEYLKNNDETNVSYVTSIIYNLASTVVQIESESGTNGSIPLHGDGSLGDNCNAEATALNILGLRLSIASDTTIQDTYNRIQNRLLGTVLFDNKLPYSKGGEVTAGHTSHYHSYAVFELIHALKPTFSTRQYLFEISTPSGAIKELGYNENPDRRGLGHTATYFASILFMNGENISDYEQACSILSYLLSVSYPIGGHENPIDGWHATGQQANINFNIEGQVIAECILYALQ